MPHSTFANSGPSLVGHTLDNGRLEFLSILGVGAYGVVYLAVDLHAVVPVYLAIKCLLRAGLDSRQRHFQRREIALHQLASRHPNIVTLHKVIEEGDYIFVVMDFCDEGDLFGMITERQRYIGEDALIRQVFLQIVDAVEYCHSMGIFHRDLKPENILCTRDGSRICIADFGLATSERTSTDFGCGSTFYLSPECQGGLFERLELYHTSANDIWALGVILVNLTCGRNPWRQACPADETFRAFVNNPEFLRTILPISHATNNILKGLFALDPRERMSLHELRRAVLAVDTFTMTEDELRTAHTAARAAAAAVRPIPPAEKVVVPQPEIEMEDVEYYHQADPAKRQRWSNPCSAIENDDSIMDQIDITPQPVGYQKQAPTISMLIPRQPIPDHIESFDSDPCPMESISSNSSSSGDGDISLPPTPEFNPVDTINPAFTPRSPRWDVEMPTKTTERPDLLHISLNSPPPHGDAMFSL